MDEPEFPSIAELPTEFYTANQSITEQLEAKPYTQTEPVYREGNMIVIRNSKFGACPREIWAYGSGMEPTREKYESSVFAEGHLHEAAVKQQMRKWGWIVEREEEEFEFRVGGIIIRGHADIGRLRIPGHTNEYCGEIKSFGHDAWEKWNTFGFDAYPSYLMQTSVMMLALGLPGMFIGKNRDNGKMTEPIFWDAPPIGKIEVIRRAMMLKRAIESNEMPDCGSARKHFSGWCLFSQLHKDVPIVEGSVFKPDFEWVLAEYKNLKKTKATEERQKELLRLIEKEMPDEPDAALICGDHKAVRDFGTVFDRKAFANAHPDLFQKFIKKNDGKKIVVKGIKEKDLLEDEDGE